MHLWTAHSNAKQLIIDRAGTRLMESLRASASELFGNELAADFHQFVRSAAGETQIPFVMAEAQRFEFLAQKLDVLAALNAELYWYFRRQLLRTDLDRGNYHGNRFEIDIAASLLQRGLRIEQVERPDFIVAWGRTRVAVECTTLRRESDIRPSWRGQSKLVNKLTRQISKKAASAAGYRDRGDTRSVPMAMANQILAIEVTNLFYRSAKVNMGDLDRQFRKVALGALEQTIFSAVLLFACRYDDVEQKLSSLYIRIDASSIQPQVRRFLDAHYPRGHIPPKASNVIISNR